MNRSPASCQQLCLRTLKYVGLKHGQELIDLVRNSLAIVLPSICYENQPFSILEAFASGKSVIASDLGGITELVTHRERGLLVEPETLMRWRMQCIGL